MTKQEEISVCLGCKFPTCKGASGSATQYKKALNSGKATLNDIRVKCGLSPIESGDELTVKKE